jgi:glycosyltransferase involved in cell wall biosynthesis
MSPSSGTAKPSFVVATPGRSVCDDNARALHRHGLLRFLALGTRRGAAGVPPEFTRLNPKIGLAAYIAARLLPTYRSESFRFRLHPWFDHWVKKQLLPGDHIISSYGYANDCFREVRRRGGKTFVDGGNSHPKDFWSVLAEEHKRWNCPYPPVSRHYYERALDMMDYVDYVLSPSAHVTSSFLKNGFKPEQILKNVYPVDTSCFRPPDRPRPKDRPLTLIAPGSLSLRKGTPYLLEAFRLVVKKIPTARLVLIRVVFENVAEILRKNADLPIDWLPPLSRSELAGQMRQSDLLILPSLEEGLARIIIEGWACGLPAIITPNTGAAEYVVPNRNGAVVPIRDPAAIAEAVLKWADLNLNQTDPSVPMVDPEIFSFATFEDEFLRQLTALGLTGALANS